MPQASHVGLPMNSECTICAIIGFIVLPAALICGFVLPIFLVTKEKSPISYVKAIWIAATAIPLLAIFSGTFIIERYWKPTSLGVLYVLSLFLIFAHGLNSISLASVAITRLVRG